MAATFVLLPGASSDSWYWHLVAPRLAAAGHDVVAVDLPLEDDSCGLAEYAAAALDAVEGSPRRTSGQTSLEPGDLGRPLGESRLIVVAQSMGAYTAPLIATKVAVEQIVLVAPMVPAPGETPGQWWANTGQPDAARAFALEEGRDPDGPFDPVETFLHDVDPDVVAASAAHVLRQSDHPFGDPLPLERWPDTPTRAIIGRWDRLFPRTFLGALIEERLRITPAEIDSGHLPALSRPDTLAEMLLGFVS